MNRTRRNRLVAQVEDVIYTAVVSLAEREGQTVSALVRDIIVSELARQELLPEPSLQSLAGVRR